MFRLLIVLIAITLLVGLPASTSRATTITVDGNPDDWPTASLLATDVAGDSVSSTADFEAIYFTNDSTHMYWRFDTYSSTSWGLVAGIRICLDVDNDVANNDYSWGCEAADTYVVFTPSSGGGRSVYRSSGPPLGATPLDIATEGRVTEISIRLADLQLPAQCTGGSTCTIPSVLRIYTMRVPDSVPDTGTMPAQIPAPTTVTMRGMQAVTANRTISMVLPVGLILAGYSLFVLVRGRQNHRRAADQ